MAVEVLEQIVDPGAELGYDRYWCAVGPRVTVRYNVLY